MHSHRRPRGRILFEVVCALIVGVSFVGAWIQTGAWAFIAPAFVFTSFGLYWAIDMLGQGSAVQARAALAAAPERVPDPEPVVDIESAVMPEIRFERFEAAPEREVERFEEPEIHTDVVRFAPRLEPAPIVKAEAKPRGRKTRAKKVASIVEPAATIAADELGVDHHIEQLFDPQPFARQARPAFGKRGRGAGARPLTAG